ncbi:MAG: pyrroline-5-carboxylate reductase [Gammaproteobacteria bacterium]|nr:pyrroline-5-carboxylate reductase [Gammaproteobacteria bacterium]
MTTAQTRIGFIGGGNMAYAIAGGLLQAGHSAACVHISDPSDAQLQRFETLNPGIVTGGDNAATLAAAEVLVLAVKPQLIEDVLRPLRDAERPDGQLAISIAAGMTLDSLLNLLEPTRSIVRVMPNQPALVGAGMSVLAATPETTGEQRDLAQYVAAATGRAEWIDDEGLMDAVTAVSGSGPAYFYLLMELMEAVARDMGLSPKLAAALVRQTAFGAGRVAVESDLGLVELRESVTSRGGTTAAALAAFEQEGIRDIVDRALRAARGRSIELGALMSAGNDD